jgi:hypothetical protein
MVGKIHYSVAFADRLHSVRSLARLLRPFARSGSGRPGTGWGLPKLHHGGGD